MPTTALGALSVPVTGTEVGTWGSASVNPNMVAIDGSARGVQTISLSSATTFTLGAPSGSITPGAGPTAAQNAVLKFSGTLSGNAVITLPLPGYYIVKNNCVVGASNYVQLRAVGTGNLIGAPVGGAWHVYNDGTDIEFVNLGHPGELLDLTVSTTPAWMSACTVKPYLLTDATVYSTSTFPALGAALGSTFGGNGVSTFGVPDLRNRFRASMAYGGAGGRITNAVSGVAGDVFGSAGGQQSVGIAQSNLPNVNFNVTDLGHTHSGANAQNKNGNATNPVSSGGNFWFGPAMNNIDANTTGISVNSGGSGNQVVILNPAMIFGLTFIKT